MEQTDATIVRTATTATDGRSDMARAVVIKTASMQRFSPSLHTYNVRAELGIPRDTLLVGYIAPHPREETIPRCCAP
jgi:hypothetical protein